ncbi:MAG: zinc ribbon domain-containing protein [Anaerolineaceae bacterium]|nr:zinc ribbon domain-containing protein [Anaerolineaceae bacterium]
MPIYEYRCQDCEVVFEALRSIKDSDSPINCKKCQSMNTHRVQSACFSKVSGSSSSASSSGCTGCNGGSCSGCSH